MIQVAAAMGNVFSYFRWVYSGRY